MVMIIIGVVCLFLLLDFSFLNIGGFRVFFCMIFYGIIYLYIVLKIKFCNVFKFYKLGCRRYCFYLF